MSPSTDRYLPAVSSITKRRTKYLYRHKTITGDETVAEKTPGFAEINRIEESALLSKLDVARQLIVHPAEKGRSLEGEVRAVLRDMLPSEYGLGTGFVVYHGPNGPKLSSQLDIIIYDAIRSGPLGRLAACEVYPIEAVYGYVEVKAALGVAGPKVQNPGGDSIQDCLIKNHTHRQMRRRAFWDPWHGSPPQMALRIEQWLALRAFVFAFEAKGAKAKDPKTLAQAISNDAKRYDAHLHGVLVLDQSYASTIPVDVDKAEPSDMYHVSYTSEDTFTAFKLHLLKALTTFQRPHPTWVPATELYYESSSTWQEVSPE
jgi:hypothetical protein